MLNVTPLLPALLQELVVGSDIKEILGKRPEDRTEEEIQQVLFALRTYETFAEYPLNMQVHGNLERMGISWESMHV